jgi:hypothetical protein
MNVLDENIPEDQRQLLRSWRIRTRQIGQDVGRPGMKDDEIIPLLLQLHRPTLFTRDRGFYEPRFCHQRYCLVFLAVGPEEAASFIRRTLRHAELDTHAKRLNKVIEVRQSGIRISKLNSSEMQLNW